MPVTYSNIGLQEPSTITNKVAAVSIDRGSTTEQQEILVLGDPQSSLGLAQVVATDPASTAYGLVVRPVGYSTTVQVSSLAGTVLVSPVSTASVRVAQSTAADLQATVTPASTVWAVQAAQSGSWTVRADLSSTSADNPVSASQAGAWSVGQASTVWAVQLTQYSTTANVSSVAGVVAVAPVLGALQTYAASTTGQSTSTVIVSSNAATKAHVYAFSVISTVAGPVAWGLYSGSTLLWNGVLAALSSAVSGNNLAVTPPGYLFANSSGSPLTFNCASSNAGLTVSLAYWVA